MTISAAQSACFCCWYVNMRSDVDWKLMEEEREENSEGQKNQPRENLLQFKQ